MKVKLFSFILVCVLLSGVDRLYAVSFLTTPQDTVQVTAEAGRRDSTLMRITKTTPSTYDTIIVDSLWYRSTGFPQGTYFGLSDSLGKGIGNPPLTHWVINDTLVDSSRSVKYNITFFPPAVGSYKDTLIILTKRYKNGFLGNEYDTLLVRGNGYEVYYLNRPDSVYIGSFQTGQADSIQAIVINTGRSGDSIVVDSIRFQSSYLDSAAYFVIRDSIGRKHQGSANINRILLPRPDSLKFYVRFQSSTPGWFSDRVIIRYRILQQYSSRLFYDTLAVGALATSPPPPHQNRYAAFPDSFILAATIGVYNDLGFGYIWNSGGAADTVIVDSLRMISTKNDSALPFIIYNDSAHQSFPEHINRILAPYDTLEFNPIFFEPISPGVYKDSILVYYRIGASSIYRRIDTLYIEGTAILPPSSRDTMLVWIPDTLLAGPRKLPGDTITVPIYLKALKYNNHNGIYSFQTELSYNDSLFDCIGYDSVGTLLGNFGGLSRFSVQFRTDSGSYGALDTIRIAGASDDSLYYFTFVGLPAGFPYPLIRLKFRIPLTAHNGDSTALHFKRFMFNEGVPGSLTDDGSIKLRLRKIGDVDKNGVIQPYDAILVLRYVIHDTTLDAESRIAAEVSGNGEITAYDAALILMYWVGKITMFPAGTYYKQALPSNKGADIVMEWGEVKDGTISLLVKAKNLTEVYGYSLALSYDPGVLTYQGYQSSDWTKGRTAVVRNEGGQVRMAVAGVDPLNGDGEIVSFKFKLNSNGDLNRDELVNLSELVLNEEVLISNTGIASLPKTYSLEQNYPNPFNPETRIRYQILEARNVQLIVYNLLGQPVRTLVNEQKPAGVYEVRWDGKNDQGINLASGVYIYRIKAGNFVSTRKLILMK